jgi:hypothetical protein
MLALLAIQNFTKNHYSCPSDRTLKGDGMRSMWGRAFGVVVVAVRGEGLCQGLARAYDTLMNTWGMVP